LNLKNHYLKQVYQEVPKFPQDCFGYSATYGVSGEIYRNSGTFRKVTTTSFRCFQNQIAENRLCNKPKEAPLPRGKTWKPSREVDRHQTLEEVTLQQYERTKVQQAQVTRGFVTEVQPHTLRSTSPLRNPQRVDLYT
jgi:hypothetical protein